MLLPMDEKQFEYWNMRRNRIPNITIATMRGISRQVVSRALLHMDGVIETALREMAEANQIVIDSINTDRGVLLGHSIPFVTPIVIFVSEKHGIQVWAVHNGDCGTCQRYEACTELLCDYAYETGIRIERTSNPNKMAEELFTKVKASL